MLNRYGMDRFKKAESAEPFSVKAGVSKQLQNQSRAQAPPPAPPPAPAPPPPATEAQVAAVCWPCSFSSWYSVLEGSSLVYILKKLGFLWSVMRTFSM